MPALNRWLLFYSTPIDIRLRKAEKRKNLARQKQAGITKENTLFTQCGRMSEGKNSREEQWREELRKKCQTHTPQRSHYQAPVRGKKHSSFCPLIN